MKRLKRHTARRRPEPRQLVNSKWRIANAVGTGFHQSLITNHFSLSLSPPATMQPEILLATFYVLILAAFLGYQVISRVPSLLHTPLMSATNAISGISLVGSLVTAGAHQTMVSAILGLCAVICSTTNVVSGFILTDRMLKMFKRRVTPPSKEEK
jgi:H+-translocating NAD(P) transhydrogenase subunit alpha